MPPLSCLSTAKHTGTFVHQKAFYIRFFLPLIAITSGEAIKTVEYTPEIKPTKSVKAKLLKTSPPHIIMATTTRRITPDVRIVLASV